MIVNFHQYTKYHKKLSEIVNQLTDMSEQIHSGMVNLAILGKWQEWSDGQPEGAVFEFTEDMLRNTGDKNVDALVELMDKILDTKDVLLPHQKMEKKREVMTDKETEEYEETLKERLEKRKELGFVEEIPLWDFPEGSLD
jgi:uncharacterized protein YwgA